MKKIIIILLFPLSVFSQTFIGQKITDVIADNLDKRYNVNKFESVGIINDTLSADFFYAYDSDTSNVGTVVFFHNKTLVVKIQSFVYKKSQRRSMMDNFLYLVNQGYIVMYKELDEERCYLEAKKW